MSEFVQGIELCRQFYEIAVKPILDTHFPDLQYAAALLGNGSEILGYDTEMSSDHHWGPRILLFLSPEDKLQQGEAIHTSLANHLPYSFQGYSTHFSEPDFGDGENGTQRLEIIDAGTINHRVEIFTLREFVLSQLGFDIEQPLTSMDWLSFPQQKLLTITAGAVYHDEIGLEALRDQFAYYPQDIWLYMLACAWSRISQDEHLAPRAGYVGDELGSAVIAGRLVSSIMQLSFLMEKTYAPYPKWFGTGFIRLDCGKSMLDSLRRVQTGLTWQDRESALVEAYTHLNRLHNALKITPAIEPAVEQFHGRPFQVSNGWRYSEAITHQIQDEQVRAIAARPQIGNIDQYSDNTDMREGTHLRKVLRQLYN